MDICVGNARFTQVNSAHVAFCKLAKMHLKIDFETSNSGGRTRMTIQVKFIVSLRALSSNYCFQGLFCLVSKQAGIPFQPDALLHM